MSTPPRTRLEVSITSTAQVSLSRHELAQALGISGARLERLVALGAIEPTTAGGDEFSAAGAVRLGRMLRLRADLGVHLVDASIILDLLERLEHLESELARVRTEPLT